MQHLLVTLFVFAFSWLVLCIASAILISILFIRTDHRAIVLIYLYRNKKLNLDPDSDLHIFILRVIRVTWVNLVSQVGQFSSRHNAFPRPSHQN